MLVCVVANIQDPVGRPSVDHLSEGSTGEAKLVGGKENNTHGEHTRNWLTQLRVLLSKSEVQAGS